MQSIENPAKWEAMQGEQVKLVTLARSCQEYLEVQKLFQKTAHNFVIEQVKSYGEKKMNSWAGKH